MKKISIWIFLFSFLSVSVRNLIADRDPMALLELSLWPHQIGICDVACVGTVLSSNDIGHADLAVEDILWGNMPSTNITVENVYPYSADFFEYHQQERYLVFAFTNNWWANTSHDDTEYERLGNYLSVTSRPPGNVVFDNYRTMYPYYTVIPFSLINENGSNRWNTTRTLVTNLMTMARIRNDGQSVREIIDSLVEMGQRNSGLSPTVWNQLWMYKGVQQW